MHNVKIEILEQSVLKDCQITRMQNTELYLQPTSFAFLFFDKSQLLSLGKIPRSMFNYKVFVSIRQICKRENVKYAKEKMSTATFDSEGFV